MRITQTFIPVLLCALLLGACDYIVLPEEEGSSKPMASKGWSAIVTNVAKSDAGNLRIDLAIRNETTDWSAMQAAPDRPAVLVAGGKNINCDTVFVGTGGHRLAPGFQMRGFTAGTQSEPKTQLLYVECKGAEAAPGSKLIVEYSYVTGEYNYYYAQANKTDARMELNLDQVVKEVKYPIAASVPGLILKSDNKIKALNDCIFTLADVSRTAQGIQFKWSNSNPGEYPTYVHIGNPPVIGADGIIYGIYETPDIVSAPITSAGKTAEWTTDVTVPKEVKGLYILLSVESKKQRLFTNYAVDITDK